jgi:secretion/DNA translocation related TadE-like protein
VRRSEAGFATVWVLAAITVVVAAAAVAICYGAAILQRHRAGAAADAVALVVALRAVEGPTVACRAGTALGRLDGAEVIRCTLVGATAEVTVAVRLRGVLSGLGSAIAEARAGPASAQALLSPSTPR